MKFETYSPCEILKPFISYLAIAETIEESSYRLLPKSGLTFCFQYRLNNENFNYKQFTLCTSGLNGLIDSSVLQKTPLNAGAIVVYFLEGGAAPFFREPLHLLFSSNLMVEDFMSKSESLLFENRLCEAFTDRERIQLVEQFFLSRINNGRVDKQMLSAAEIITKRNGSIRIKELTADLRISQRSFETRFSCVVGTTPKKFASIVRFNYIVKHYRSAESVERLIYDTGFYDQAHFINEIKSITGQSPERFFNNL
jgi:AraC-like DNA-binding protein